MSVRASRFLSLVLHRAGEMAAAGHVFYCSANGVWLVDHVPPKFIDFKDPVRPVRSGAR
ncbi:MAG TPA: hypothetical protein VLM79_32725 [Kofleriaceae bacterium]|nr:hypothetical protein [Kofleriaceae bacterium]